MVKRDLAALRRRVAQLTADDGRRAAVEALDAEDPVAALEASGPFGRMVVDTIARMVAPSSPEPPPPPEATDGETETTT